MGSSRSVLPSIIVLCLTASATGGGFPIPQDLEPPGHPQSWGCIPDVPGYERLAENGTEGDLLATMMADRSPPWYENETVNIGITVQAWTDEPEENGSVGVWIGQEEMAPPECQLSTIFNSTQLEGGTGLIYVEAAANITPARDRRVVVARVEWRNRTLNLTYEGNVLAPRTWLVPSLDQAEDREFHELNWTPVRILLENRGGAGTSNLVVDVRYGGRVISTHEIPHIGPFDVYPLELAFMPAYGSERMDVVLLTGPDAPEHLWPSISMTVKGRPVLDVVALEAEPAAIVSGERVRIEATVRNRGNGTSTGQRVELMVDGTVVENGTIEGLAPGAETRVSADWTLRGVGVHIISARAEGDDFDALPVSVEVERDTPGPGAAVALVALALTGALTRAVRRS